jgi:hypothetical protein
VLQNSRRNVKKLPTSVMLCGRRMPMAPVSWGRVSAPLFFVLYKLFLLQGFCHGIIGVAYMRPVEGFDAKK